MTPVRPWQLIVGKLFPFAAIGLVTTLLVTALSVLGFGRVVLQLDMAPVNSMGRW